MMMRKQARMGGWMAAVSLAATTVGAALPATAGDSQPSGRWVSGDDSSESVVSDTSVALGDPSAPDDASFAATDGADGYGTETFATSAGYVSDEVSGVDSVGGGIAHDGVIVEDGSGSSGWSDWAGDVWNYPGDSGPFEQPGLLQVLRDKKCATWTFRADALLLWRNSPQGLPIYSQYMPTVTPNGYGATALDASQMESGMAAGPRFSVFRTNDCEQAWEFTWFQAANFRSQEATLPTLGGYAITPAVPPTVTGSIYGNQFVGLDTATSDLSASISSFEINRWERWRPNVAFLHGFRMVQWGENLSLADHYDTTATGYSQDVFRNNCLNNLYGYQIGTDIRLWDRGNGFRIDGIMKGGAYYNNAVQNSWYTYQTVTPGVFETGNVRAAGGAAAFVGEVGLTGTIPITCNVSLRVGYLGLWLQGLAQPTNQLRGQTITPNGPPVLGSLNTIGGTVVQGVSLGLEGRW